jgi:hypothetical protein
LFSPRAIDTPDTTMKFSTLTFVVALASGVLSTTLAYPTGAPVEACDTMLPDHFVSPQTAPCPYTLTVVGNGDGTFDGKETICFSTVRVNPFRNFFKIGKYFPALIQFHNDLQLASTDFDDGCLSASS